MEEISLFVNRCSLTLVVSILIPLSRIDWLETENGVSVENCIQPVGKLPTCLNALVYHVQDGATVTLAKMRHRYAQQARFAAYTEYKSFRPSNLRLLLRVARMLHRAADRKLRGFKHWPTKKLAYYQHEVKAAASLASARYFLRLFFSRRFREIVLRENWIDESVHD